MTFKAAVLRFSFVVGITVVLSMAFAQVVNQLGKSLSMAREAQLPEAHDRLATHSSSSLFFPLFLLPTIVAGAVTLLLSPMLHKSIQTPKTINGINTALRKRLTLEHNAAILLPSTASDRLSAVATAAVSLAAGISLGRLGPCVTLGTSVANFIGPRLGLNAMSASGGGACPSFIFLLFRISVLYVHV